ncbi:MAG: 3-keto-5-aminohexanoate cleavage protein [Gammaproteobacteria bacterium]|nr:3-keto-5-aminohexanoate cleavage protein [Gammaproteobacteria bacterium]
MGQPLIIEVALNGGMRKTRNAQVPRTPAEIAEDALGCIAAGAAIVHSHTDDPVLSGSGVHDPAPYIEAWRPVIRAHPAAILYPTMPGGLETIPVEQRYAHVPALARAGVLGMGLVDPGTTNFGRLDANGVPRSEVRIYRNSYADAVYMLETCRSLGVGISFSIFEPGFLLFVLGYQRAGKLPPGSFVKLYFSGPGVLFGFPPSRVALAAYLDMLSGTGLPWLVSVQGGDVFADGFAEHAVQLGGHLQVGLEPSGDAHASNVELVRRAVTLARAMDRPVATCERARELLF